MRFLKLKKFIKKYDFIIELPCVAPLRDSHDIDGALSMLIEKGSDSVISVVGTVKNIQLD